MSFLAPLWLALAGAAAVPLLIHLLRRRIGTRVEFPAARYLARAEQEHSRSLKLRNLLLMLLRVAIVLLVALAAARPVALWAGAGHGPTALAIVFDNSLSSSAIVDGRALLEQFRGMARDALAQATPNDRLWLVTADGRVRGGSAGVLREELERVGSLSGAGDLRLALSRASGAVRASGIDSRQVAVLSDGQRTAWSFDAELGDVQLLLWLAPGTPPSNRAVLAADARPERWTPRGAVAARLMTRDSATYRINLGGRSLARGTAAANEEIVIHAAPPERGWLAGTVELEPDELPGDNVRHFALWIGPAPGVNVSAAAGPFVKNAVDVLRASGRIAEGRDIGVVPADELSSLPALVLAPSDPVRLGAANRALERANIPWRFGAVRRGEAAVTGRAVATASRPATDNAATAAPAGAPAPADLGDVTASLRYELVAQSGADADTLATVGREPWIVAGPRYVLLASPITPDATNFPIRAAFIPWLAEMLTERLVGEPGEVAEATPSERIARPRWADAMESSNGARVTLGEDLEAPAQAGVYFLERAGRRVGALVVDPDQNESVLDRTTSKDITGRVKARNTLTAADRVAWTTMAFRSAARRPIAVPLLITALVLLALEAALVGRGRRQAA